MVVRLGIPLIRPATRRGVSPCNSHRSCFHFHSLRGSAGLYGAAYLFNREGDASPLPLASPPHGKRYKLVVVVEFDRPRFDTVKPAFTVVNFCRVPQIISCHPLIILRCGFIRVPRLARLRLPAVLSGVAVDCLPAAFVCGFPHRCPLMLSALCGVRAARELLAWRVAVFGPACGWCHNWSPFRSGGTLTLSPPSLCMVGIWPISDEQTPRIPVNIRLTTTHS